MSSPQFERVCRRHVGLLAWPGGSSFLARPVAWVTISSRQVAFLKQVPKGEGCCAACRLVPYADLARGSPLLRR
ncbi:MAG: hypothetical protein JWO88_3246 [Frankiales bacterium]|nr:hypothetical protein [Frankiales bacterium]